MVVRVASPSRSMVRDPHITMQPLVANKSAKIKIKNILKRPQDKEHSPYFK